MACAFRPPSGANTSGGAGGAGVLGDSSTFFSVVLRFFSRWCFDFFFSVVGVRVRFFLKFFDFFRS